MTATISLVEATHPDGLTAAAGRMQASVVALDTQISAQQRAVAELRGGWQGAGAATAGARAEQDLQRQQRLRAQLSAVQAALSAGGPNLNALCGHILSLAAQARMLGGIVSDNVSVYVPGTGGVPFDRPDSGNDLPTYVEQAEWLKGQAEAVRRLEDPNATVATVAWIGYEPPSNLAKAGLPGYADTAAPKRPSFINGLGSSRLKDPHLTVIGHSYGSVVTSEALQRGTAADDVIFTGSPGLETNPRSLQH
jgi:hypothetical protein